MFTLFLGKKGVILFCLTNAWFCIFRHFLALGTSANSSFQRPLAVIFATQRTAQGVRWKQKGNHYTMRQIKSHSRFPKQFFKIRPNLLQNLIKLPTRLHCQCKAHSEWGKIYSDSKFHQNLTKYTELRHTSWNANMCCREIWKSDLCW